MGIEGKWQLQVSTPMGEQTLILILDAEGKGSVSGALGKVDISGAKIEGDRVHFSVSLTGMGRSISVEVSATANGDDLSGTLNTPLGNSRFTGARVIE